MLVKDIMTKDVVTVKKEASIREIAQTIVDHDVSFLTVTTSFVMISFTSI